MSRRRSDRARMSAGSTSTSSRSRSTRGTSRWRSHLPRAFGGLSRCSTPRSKPAVEESMVPRNELEKRAKPLLDQAPVVSDDAYRERFYGRFGAPRPQWDAAEASWTGNKKERTPEAIAQAGTAGAGKSLPFLDQIQASFGRHDVSAVQSHTDEP